MGLQPIDLQTMYSQLSNVAKQAAYQQQGIQLNQSMQQAEKVRQNIENNKKVQQMEEGQKASGIDINQNGKGSSSFYEQSKKNKEKELEQDSFDNFETLKKSFLGQHIDIKR